MKKNHPREVVLIKHIESYRYFFSYNPMMVSQVTVGTGGFAVHFSHACISPRICILKCNLQYTFCKSELWKYVFFPYSNHHCQIIICAAISGCLVYEWPCTQSDRAAQSPAAYLQATHNPATRHLAAHNPVVYPTSCTQPCSIPH